MFVPTFAINKFRWFIPWLYIRPTYFMIITPFGTQVISYPPIYVIPASVFLLTMFIGLVYIYICQPNGGCCCFWGKCLSKCLFERNNNDTVMKKILIFTDIFGDQNMKNLLSLLLLTSMMKKKKIEIVGIITTGGNNKIRAEHTIEWLKYLNLLNNIPVTFGRDIDDTVNLFLEENVTVSSENRNDNDNDISKVSPTKLILELAKKHEKNLYIYSTTGVSLTPLNDAIKKDKASKYLKAIGGIFINNLHVKCEMNRQTGRNKCWSSSSKDTDEANKIIVPSNFKKIRKLKKGKLQTLVDGPSTHCVFQKLQLKVPFTIFDHSNTSASSSSPEENINNNISRDIINNILTSKTFIRISSNNKYKIKTIEKTDGGSRCNNDAALFGLYLDNDINDHLIVKKRKWGKHCIVTKGDDTKINKLIDKSIDYAERRRNTHNTQQMK
jgi:hypothetical protein